MHSVCGKWSVHPPGERLAGTPEPMHTWTASQGLAIRGDAWGHPSNPLVILQHGGGQTRHAWKRTGQTLGESGYHAVAFDARGHGDSQWSPFGDYSISSMADDLRCVVRAMKADRCFLIGASMGGYTSLMAAATGAVAAAGIVLVDIAPRVEASGAQRIRAFMARNPDGFASLEEVAETIASYQPGRIRPTDLSGLGKNVRRFPDGRYRWHWDPSFLHAILASPDQYQMEQFARSLSIPTLLIRGAQSDVVKRGGVEDFLALVPHAEYAEIESAGHMIASDRNDEFGNAVVEFLKRQFVSGP